MKTSKIFQVQICQSNTKIVDVDAKDEQEAFEKANQMYENGEVLFTGDFSDGREESWLEGRIWGGDPDTTGQYRFL